MAVDRRGRPCTNLANLDGVLIGEVEQDVVPAAISLANLLFSSSLAPAPDNFFTNCNNHHPFHSSFNHDSRNRMRLPTRPVNLTKRGWLEEVNGHLGVDDGVGALLGRPGEVPAKLVRQDAARVQQLAQPCRREHQPHRRRLDLLAAFVSSQMEKRERELKLESSVKTREALKLTDRGINGEFKNSNTRSRRTWDDPAAGPAR
jgi:hypothetical protein